MQCRYADAFEAKVRNKRNPLLARGIAAAGNAIAKAAKPYVDDAIKAAKPYVDDAVKAAKSAADDVVQGTKSLYQNITKGSSVRNIQTDVTKKTFERNLESSGFTKTTSNGVTHFTKGNTRYTTRNYSNQGSRTADYYPNGSRTPFSKIRLGD
ncbi:hypothetical protein [Paenibacillus popilliae]|uniref:Uncharacterized protein n=1 Tax=Paenibacillus popilliae ATCC 14706 TaxID=1212764 RepID=M9LKH1_PAEPP|nr:hypothetical protein [Paenibacillus popilliae]GAC43810.1 hypothetical protein PPOP_3210 [Paenibacillus popilliae ATCC 14706]